MKSAKRNAVFCFLVLSLFLIAGCDKEPEQTTPPSVAPQGTAPQTAAPQGTTPPAATAPASVDIDRPIAEIQAQAQTMSVDSLKATAMKYKEAITSKQAEIEKVLAKIKDIPIANALGEEAKTLKTDLANLETTLKALKDRFQVYYDTLKEKGGDLSGLAF